MIYALKRCRHCEQALVTRPRQLCRLCYGNQAIRKLYPARTINYAKRSRRSRRLANHPTQALPGSPAKLDVMIKRFEQGRELFHPLDA